VFVILKKFAKGEIEMKNITAQMLAKDLKTLVSLPNYDDNQKIELLIRPLGEKKRTRTAAEIVKSLTGVIPDKGQSLEEIRSERLAKKYESLN